MITEPESVAIRRDYVTDETFVPRLSRAYTRYVLGQPVMVWLFIGFALIGNALIISGAANGGAGPVAGGIALLLYLPFIPVVIYRRTAKANKQRIPVGSRISITLGHETMRSEGPLGSSDTSYRAFDRVRRAGDFVLIRMRGLRTYAVYPVDLFPGPDFGHLRASVERANS